MTDPNLEMRVDWLETELPAYFQGRILPIDQLVGDRWGRLLAKAGRPLPTIDSLLAATAAAHSGGGGSPGPSRGSGPGPYRSAGGEAGTASLNYKVALEALAANRVPAPSHTPFQRISAPQLTS